MKPGRKKGGRNKETESRFRSADWSLSYAQIARSLGISRQAVHAYARRRGIRREITVTTVLPKDL